MSSRIYSGALGFFNNKSFGVQVVGIDVQKEEKLSFYSKRITRGRVLSKNLKEVLVGKKVAQVLGLKLGDELVLISQGADGSIANDIFRVVGVVGLNQSNQDDHRIYMSLKSAQDFLSLSASQVHEIAILLNRIDDSRKISDKINEFFKVDFNSDAPDLKSRPWQKVEAQFYQTMKADKQGNYITLLILVIMVGVSVLNTFLMSILERTREFGVLKALGTSSSYLFSLIVLESVVLAFLSSIFGVILSLGLNYYLSFYGFKFSEPIEFGGMNITEFNAVISFSSLFYPILIIIMSAVIASLYPALKSTQISVSQSLREF